MKVSITAAGCMEADDLQVPNELARDLRRADDFILLAALTIYQTLGSTRDIVRTSDDRCGLVLGTAFGPLHTNFEVLDQIVSKFPISPTLFAHSVFNGAAGYLTRIFQIQGSALTLTDFSLPFFQALQQGCAAILQGTLDQCFVLQVETYSPLLHDARQQILGEGTRKWLGGCTFWQLEPADSTDAGTLIDDFTIITKPVSGNIHLVCNQQLQHNGQSTSLHDPLAAGREITQILTSSQGPDRHHFSLHGPEGSLTLALQTEAA